MGLKVSSVIGQELEGEGKVAREGIMEILSFATLVGIVIQILYFADQFFNACIKPLCYHIGSN